METDQALLAFLTDGRNYPERASRIVYHETHISHVFVGDTTVYKIKKPVNYGFLDFTTLAKRHFYCKEEAILNARLAGDTYLGVKAIYGREDRYSFRRLRGYAVVEYAVKMRRLPEARILQTLIDRGKLLYGNLSTVGDLLARFHKGAPAFKSGPYGDVEVVRTNTEENFRQISSCRGITIDGASYDRLVGYTRGFLIDNDRLFRERKRRGLVREVHGDLHSQHVCLTDPPVIFDCIEFNKRFRITDVLEDIAFLLMDLEYRGRFDLSAAIEDAYFDVFPGACCPELLRFYMIYQIGRAHV
jgi:aminoglycoside phosphotransferase family enzyme